MTATDRLLAGVRRRLRIGWLFATTQLVVPFLALGALGLVALGWLAPWAWPEPTALLVVATGVLGLVVVTFFVPVSTEMAARAADRGLGSKDAFTSVLQFRDHARFGADIEARAERFATAATPQQAVPWKVHPKRWIVTALTGLCAVALALVANPRDAQRQESEAVAAILDNEADQLDETAELIRGLDEPTPAELATAEELNRLAEELRQLEDLSAAEQLLRDASTELSPDNSQLFSTKAAVQGLNRSLESQPLPGATGDAAEQLEQAAGELDDLTAEEIDALAERLDALAATQGAGNPAAAQALAAAAQALRSGDVASAAASLGEAAGAQRTGEGEVREGQVGQAGASAAGDGANRLADHAKGSAGQGEGQGQGQGQGDGQGQGSGQGQGEGQGEGSGEGSGQGSGQGDGSGQGSGQGQGGQRQGDGIGDGSGASGAVGGASGGSNPAGQGGRGRPVGGGDSNEVGTESEVPTLFHPGGPSDELFPGGSGSGDTETIGVGQGPTNTGSSQVPLSDVLGEFERQAVAALSDPSIPPSQRALVQRYFERLAGL